MKTSKKKKMQFKIMIEFFFHTHIDACLYVEPKINYIEEKPVFLYCFYFF